MNAFISQLVAAKEKNDRDTKALDELAKQYEILADERNGLKIEIERLTAGLKNAESLIGAASDANEQLQAVAQAATAVADETTGPSRAYNMNWLREELVKSGHRQ